MRAVTKQTHTTKETADELIDHMIETLDDFEFDQFAHYLRVDGYWVPCGYCYFDNFRNSTYCGMCGEKLDKYEI